MAVREYSDGDYIYRAGDAADGVYRLRSGQVRLTGAGPERLMSAGDVFGDSGFLLGDDRDADAIAAGLVTVDFLSRNRFLAALSLHSGLLLPLVGNVFDLVADELPVEEPQATPVSEAFSIIDGGPDQVADTRSIRLIPDGKRVRSMVGTDEIAIDRLPFRVGRVPSGEGKDTYEDVDLALADKRPFSLSRRHFAIERSGGGLFIRDFGSYHGTTLNGLRLGGKDHPVTAPLMTGESELVAGGDDSPYRFRIIVEET